MRRLTETSLSDAQLAIQHQLFAETAHRLSERAIQEWRFGDAVYWQAERADNAKLAMVALRRIGGEEE
jgi:hypothetical protein